MRNPHTQIMSVRLSSGEDRRKFFKAVLDEWNAMYNKFSLYTTSSEKREEKYFLHRIDEDVMNPEVNMNRDDYNKENSATYWFIHSIIKLKLEIQFPYIENNHNDQTQVMKGPI